jgi:xanthine dehydrogenase small subunit
MPKLLVNDREVETGLPLGSSLVDFLRNELHLHGTKIGCREGDCGACTVLVGGLEEGVLRYRAMASCLMPLGNAVGKHLVTIEGINQANLTVVQEAFVEMNGTQCGFCTPGFILSVYGFCLGEKPLTLENALESVSGNICRCTGYASIKRAIGAVVDRLQAMDSGAPLRWLVDNRFLPEYFLTVAEHLEALAIAGTPGVQEGGYVLGGGTDLLIQDFHGAHDASRVRLLAPEASLRRIRIQDGRCTLGGACTISQIMESEAIRTILPALGADLRLMASHPIRNMGTVGGNLANASPLGDLTVILMGLEATLTLSREGHRRDLPLREFFTGYKQVRLEPGEIIEAVGFDVPDASTRFSFEKASKRRRLDMATVNSSMKVVLEKGVVRRACLAAGSLGPTVLHLAATSSFLVGRRLDNATFKEAHRLAQAEIAPLSRHPGDGDHKRTLLRQQLLLHFMRFAPEAVTLEALR